ncbi:RNA polymerase III subunit Rpc25 [Penicillium taxi]|uniref:RNA polymerase III subunit Rpc25 n=1 Tax=Penicillium taxi TaxID=168475 RepID=UPI0025458279|nr:RNA polymerase III subunit Rpc25 [Penicillium taxi]KAJ5902389.1 RNA polymerase III subunit Rpc25 [Penicillium taxi]
MFIISTIADLIPICPEDFDKSSAVAIEDNINAKYANKVIQELGLCMSFYCLLEASDGLIGHGTGMVNANVTFDMIVFRPHKGEIMMGKISSGSEKGIKITMEFFSDILIPPSLLMEGAKFDHAEQVWTFQPEDGPIMYFDVGEIVRFRVEAEEWNEQNPNAPDVFEDTSEIKPVSYSIIGSMQLDGLGPVAWW